MSVLVNSLGDDEYDLEYECSFAVLYNLGDFCESIAAGDIGKKNAILVSVGYNSSSRRVTEGTDVT